MANAVSPSRIHKLSTSLANQIAAGEVIERPASVVKELLENSLDAGASEIKLDIKKGGRLLISLQDNGCGIHPEDLPLALAQHATSKLNTQAELARINTLGFRGEALSSIASVSRLKLSSRIFDEEHGWSIDVKHGDSQTEQAPIAMGVGTNVEVWDLFFNTPARRKFLRTDNTEFFHIREIVRQVALSRYDVSFHLKHNNKTILQCSGQQKDITERVNAVFGKSFLSNAFELSDERNGLRLCGWLGHPGIARNQVDRQYFYLNGRVIRDKQVNHAVRLATQDHLYTGKHAVYVLFLEMDAGDVDVNVHPTKQEVRFRQSRDVHDFIFSALKQVCEGNTAGTESSAHADISNSQYISGLFAGCTQGSQEKGIQERGAQYSSTLKSRIQAKSQAKNQYWDKPSSTSNNFLLIEDGRYLITQMEDQIFLLDVFLCQEIVVLSKLENDFAKQGIRRRPLLVPLTMNVSIEVGNLVESKVSVFKSFGLKIERVAPASLLIREIPILFEYADITKLIDDMIQLIKSGQSNWQILSMMSGHVNDAGSINIDDRLVTQLLTELKVASMTSAINLKNGAWRILDGETLSNLLKTKG